MSKYTVISTYVQPHFLGNYGCILQKHETSGIQKNDMINQCWNVNEKEKYQLAQNTLDPLEQILYSSLIGIRSLEQEAQSESAKEFLVTLKKEIERQLKELKKASISVYPICMQDLGPMGAVKSLVEFFLFCIFFII